MSDVVRYLTSLAQALAKMSLYDEGHPAGHRAADASFEHLRILQQTDPAPAFSFLSGDVVYDNRPVRELQGWDWARKLSQAGIQRLEFAAGVDQAEYRAFLTDALRRVAARRPTGEATVDARTPVGGTELIRFGVVGIRENEERERVEQEEDDTPKEAYDLSEEAETVHWVHQEVAASRDLPLAEAELVVQTLSAAMHEGQHILLPLLSLKEFDQYTTTHALNVSVLSMALAEHMGLSAREVRLYGMTGLLHDLGKVKVPVEILRKPGVLDADELAILRRHPVDGAKMILEHDKRLDLCAVVAFEHHIMIDGTGYPVRHRRCDCHNASLLVHVCDVFDALRTNRPYRMAWETNDILEYIRQRIGKEFDETTALAFIELMQSYDIRAAQAALIDGVTAGAETA